MYTWYKWNNLECKSQIDFILTKRNNRRRITDARVIPNMCADTDHKAVIITVKTNGAKNNKHKKSTKHQGQLDIQKLEELNMREKYIQEVNKEFAKLPENTQHIEEEWKYLKIPSYK